MNLSFNFIELGVDSLWHDSTWMTPVCVRHSIIAKVPGGWSHMFRQYLRLQLLGDTGLSTAGVPLLLAGKPFLLFAKLKYIVGDGDGFRMVWDWRGANSIKPCFRRSNVVSRGSDISSRDPTFVRTTIAFKLQHHQTFQILSAFCLKRSSAYLMALCPRQGSLSCRKYLALIARQAECLQMLSCDNNLTLCKPRFLIGCIHLCRTAL